MTRNKAKQTLVEKQRRGNVIIERRKKHKGDSDSAVAENVQRRQRRGQKGGTSAFKLAALRCGGAGATY